MRDRNITAQIIEHKIIEPSVKYAEEGYEGVNVSSPEVGGLPDKSVQLKINNIIKGILHRLMIQYGYGQDNLGSMLGTYKVTVNRNSILSIRFEMDSYAYQAAHPVLGVKSLTVNLSTGQVYRINNLFNKTNPYKLIISNFIKEEAQKKGIPLLENFKSINDSQEFYLTRTGLVIYWQMYQYTPGVAGVPEFNIPYSSLTKLIDGAGPIARITSR